MFAKPQDIRRREVRTTTFTEVVLVLLLVFALFAYDTSERITQRENDIRAANKNIKDLEDKNSKLENENFKLQKTIRDKDEQIKELLTLISAHQKGGTITQIEVLQKRIKELKDEIHKLENTIANQKKEIARLKNLKSDENLENKELKQQITKLEKQILALEAQVEELQQQIGTLKGTGKKDGQGKPRCFKNKTIHDFTLKIVSFKKYFQITKLWDPKDDHLYNQVPGLKAMVDAKKIPLEEFRRLGAKIEKWRNKQKPVCDLNVKLNQKNLELDPKVGKQEMNRLREMVGRWFILKIIK